MLDVKQRQAWMATLAQCEFADLNDLWQSLNLSPLFTWVRKPEIGLVQVRGRMGATGNQFNVGDVTITRAVIKLESGELGYCYVQGRNKTHAKLAALVDALMQTSNHQTQLNQALIQPLMAKKQARDQARNKEVANSKVDFFTLVRGED